jgi:MoxR-like ATPase
VQPSFSPLTDLKSRLTSLREALATGLIERDTPVRLALLAALAGEHLLLLGPPGTAKSELAKRLRYMFRENGYFERLLTRFSVPEELFGPLSIRALENDRYHRQTEGYLPSASVAFLDEIFKANSAILNSLLTLLNEREFDNGTERVKAPLTCVIGASNELPEGEELHALYDRFLLRCQVPPVTSAGFEALLELGREAQPQLEMGARLSRADLEHVRELSRSVKVPGDIKEMLKALRGFLAEEKIQVSDRRWRKIVFLLQVSAYTDGRTEVSVWDGWLLQHCLWEKPEQRQSLFEWYQQRLGTGSSAEPERFAKIVAAQERQLEIEKESRSQARDEEGHPLYLTPEDKVVRQEKGPQQKRDASGELLYLAFSNSSERSQNVSYTKQQLRERFSWYPQTLESYLGDKNNWRMENAPYLPHMEPTRYSGHHIDGRVRQVESLLREVDEVQRGLAQQIQSVTAVVDGHLWIAPGFSGPARAHLVERQTHMQRLHGRLSAVSSALRTLPRSEG